MAVTVQTMVFCVMTLYSLISVYQCFERVCWQHLQEAARLISLHGVMTQKTIILVNMNYLLIHLTLVTFNLLAARYVSPISPFITTSC